DLAQHVDVAPSSLAVQLVFPPGVLRYLGGDSDYDILTTSPLNIMVAFSLAQSTIDVNCEVTAHFRNPHPSRKQQIGIWLTGTDVNAEIAAGICSGVQDAAQSVLGGGVLRGIVDGIFSNLLHLGDRARITNYRLDGQN